MPSFVAEALRADGWYLRSKIPWIKPNPMPESVTDRPTNAVEYFFLFAKKKTYFWDAVAVRTPSNYEPHGLGLTSWETSDNFRSDQPGRRHRPSGKRYKSGSKDKQRGHSRRHDGFNDRWDAMPKAEQQAMGANMRNYLFEATVPFRGAHFATFPPAVIEPFILAGTSAKGCCPECGAPWVRQTKKHTPRKSERAARGKAITSPRQDGNQWNENDGRGFVPTKVRTLRWEPSCECKAGKPVPCTVLDPFGGAGTTGLVADRHQRDAVLIEISDEYAELARQRIYGDAPLLTEV